MSIKPLEKTYFKDDDGNITGYGYPDSQETMDKINEIIAHVNASELGDEES